MANEFSRRTGDGGGVADTGNPDLIDGRSGRVIPKRPAEPEGRAAGGINMRDNRGPAVKRDKRNREFVRDLLAGAASAASVGVEMHEEDVEAVLAQVEKDAAAAPPRVREALKVETRAILKAISDGNAAPAEARLRQAVFSIGAQLPGSFTPPAEESPAELAAMVPRS